MYSDIAKFFFSKREKTLMHTVFAVFSKNTLIQNRFRIILKLVLKKPLVKYKGCCYGCIGKSEMMSG